VLRNQATKITAGPPVNLGDVSGRHPRCGKLAGRGRAVLAYRLVDEPSQLAPWRNSRCVAASAVGSYNFSAGAAWNSEDMNIVTSPEVGEAYWLSRLAGGVRFTGAAVWYGR
jgi:hypothetical protein